MNGDLKKHTLNLRDGDWDYLEDALASTSVPVSVFIRQLIAKTVDQLRASETTTTDLNLELKNV